MHDGGFSDADRQIIINQMMMAVLGDRFNAGGDDDDEDDDDDDDEFADY